MRFVDTNVLVYAVSAALEDEEKRLRALDLLARRDLAMSVQVLQEFYVQATRPSVRERCATMRQWLFSNLSTVSPCRPSLLM